MNGGFCSRNEMRGPPLPAEARIHCSPPRGARQAGCAQRPRTSRAAYADLVRQPYILASVISTCTPRQPALMRTLCLGRCCMDWHPHIQSHPPQLQGNSSLGSPEACMRTNGDRAAGRASAVRMRPLAGVQCVGGSAGQHSTWDNQPNHQQSQSGGPSGSNQQRQQLNMPEHWVSWT